MASFITNCYCVHMCIHKYNPLSLYTVACMHVFRDDHLAVYQLVCSSLGKTNSQAPIFPQLPVVLHKGVRPHGLLSIHFVRFLSVILAQLTFGKPCW